MTDAIIDEMTDADRLTLVQAIDSWVEGALDDADARTLESRVAADRGLERERMSLERLARDLVAARVCVRPGFADAVMSRLPAHRSAPANRSWFIAIAAVVTLAVGAAALLRFGSGGATGGPLAAFGDFAASVLLAGSGLLAASWQGVGEWVGDWLGGSTSRLVVGVVLVVGVNLLLVTLLRRRRLAPGRVRSFDDRER